MVSKIWPLMFTLVSSLTAEGMAMNTFLLRSPSAIGTSRLQFGGSNIRTQHMHHHPALFISTSMKCTTPLAFRSKYIQPLQTPQLYRTGVALRMSSSSSMQPSSSSSPSSDSSTNSIHPSLNEIGVDISIEYCSSCRWMLRSSWIASELLTTFTNEPKLTSVTMIPQSPPLSEGGIFRVCASYADANNENEDQIIVLWDRKVEGRFPESKEVKQLVRDCVNPDKDLGHSDNKQQSSSDGVVPKQSSEKVDCIECNEEQQDKSTSSQQAGKPTKDKNDEKETNSSPKIPSIFYKQNKVSIEYSTGSNIDSPENELYRAAYYANELLSMIFERNSWWKKYCQCQGGDSSDATVIEETVPVVVDIVSLIPNRKENGVFSISLNDEVILSEQSTDTDVAKITNGRHLHSVVKDAIANDGGYVGSNESNNPGIELMDDDEAEEARKYFGVF